MGARAHCQGPALTQGKAAAKKAKVDFIVRSPAPRAAALDATAAARRLRVMSWNLNGYKSTVEKHKAGFLQVVAAESPDLIFLSETKLQEKNCATYAQAVPGFEAHFTCSTAKLGYAGCALLVRNEVKDWIRRISFGIDDDAVVGHDEGRSITVELDGLYLVLLYVVNSGQNLERLKARVEAWDPALRRYCRALAATKPVLVGGDLNIAHRDGDVHNPHAKQLRVRARASDSPAACACAVSRRSRRRRPRSAPVLRASSRRTRWSTRGARFTRSPRAGSRTGACALATARRTRAW